MMWILLQTTQNSLDKTTWVGLAIACIATAYVMFHSRRKKRQDPLERSSIGSSLAQQRAVERQMQNLLVELSEMSRQITAQLDTRAAKLDQMIRQADERIERLRALAGAGTEPAPRADTAGAASEPAASRPAPESAGGPDPRHQAVYALADQGRTAHQIAAELDRPSGEIELILALRPRVDRAG